MFPPPFDYHRASSVTEALSLLESVPEATVLAGGHALLPDLKAGKADVGAVVDVSRVSTLSGVDIDASTGTVTVGATTTYKDLLEAAKTTPELEAMLPSVIAATRVLGDRQIRSRGTVGGNLAAGHPDSDLPAPALVANATVEIRGAEGTRTLPVETFLEGPFETAVGDDELVTEVRFEAGRGPDSSTVTGVYQKSTHPTSGYAMVGVASRLTIDDGVVEEIRLAANGVAETATRLPSVEEQVLSIDLEAETAEAAIAAATDLAADDIPEGARRGDGHAPASYRTAVLGTFVERAIDEALDATEVDR